MMAECSCDCGISYVHDDFTLDPDDLGPFDCPVEGCGGECGGTVDFHSRPNDISNTVRDAILEGAYQILFALALVLNGDDLADFSAACQPLRELSNRWKEESK